jgi:hypothetical protein
MTGPLTGLNRKTKGEMFDKPLSRKKFLLCGLSVLEIMDEYPN